jgi:S1-C subfamily serine protease
MRPTVYVLTSAAASVAAAVITTPTAAQDRTTRDRDAAAARQRAEVVASRAGDGRFQVWSSDDGDRAVLGVMLGSARGRTDTAGVRITDVTPDGPAAKAGIEEGDRIVSIDGTNLRIDPADADDPAFADLASRRLQRALAKHKPGDEVTLGLQRGRENRTVRVKTVAADALRDDGAMRGFGFTTPGGSYTIRGAESLRALRDSAAARSERRAALGVSVGVTGSVRDTLGLFVSSVAADGPAEKAGLVEGARIASINGVDVRVAREDSDDPEIAQARARRFTRELEKHAPGEDIALRVWQNGAYRTMTVKAAKATDVWKGRNGFRFSFGDGGDDAIIMPPMPAMAPRVPMAPMQMMERVPFTQLVPSAGTRIITTPRAPSAPRAVLMPRRVMYL